MKIRHVTALGVFLIVVGFFCAVLLAPELCTAGDTNPENVYINRTKASPNAVKRADFYLKKFENRVERMRGQKFPLGHEGNEALRRIKKLMEDHPEDPAVKDLYLRARAALMASKGGVFQITPEMTAFRENEKKMQKLFAEVAQKDWQAYKEAILAKPDLIKEPFPAPSHREFAVEDLVGKYVILEGFQFPTNEFTDFDRQFVFIGSGVTGYYWIDLGGRDFLSPYEAIKRYRRLINQNVPEGGDWTIVGRITGLELLVPQAGKKKTKRAHWGWKVTPEAIWVPDITFARYQPDLKLGAQFSGEEKMEAIKSKYYTVTSIPKNVSPQRLVEIYVAAIKEKNYKLYLDCIDPRRRMTPAGSARIQYHWDLHQKRFATLYVHVDVGEPQTWTLSGFNVDDKLEGFFLSDKQKKSIEKRTGPLVEMAYLTTKAYDEKGTQYGSPKPRMMRRIDRQQWHITNFPQPF